MVRGKQLTAIVPARGGSKGLPGKNLLELGGSPLVVRAAKLALSEPRVGRVIVSSDDPAILDAVSPLAGVEARLRPDDLSGDEARSTDLVEHLIETAGIEPGFLLLLQPTSPLRTVTDLSDMLSIFETSSADAAISVTLLEEPRPEKLQRIEDGRLQPYLDTGYEGPRQALARPYALNGAFYLIDQDVFLRVLSFHPHNTMPFVMPAQRSANIDTLHDWQVLNAMIAAGHWSLDDTGL